MGVEAYRREVGPRDAPDLRKDRVPHQFLLHHDARSHLVVD
jgi:hypothetical protein